MCELLLRDDTQHHSVRTGLIPASQSPPHPHCSSFFHGEWKCITWREMTALAREWRAWGWPAQAPCSSQLQGVGAGTLALNRDQHLPSGLAAGVLGLFSSWAALGWVTWATDVPLMFQLLWTQKAFHPLWLPVWILLGLPRWLSHEEYACQCRRHGFHPCVRKIPWRRK